ncbi:MAG: hypothetical protein V7K97_11460 [Nostoc sp.]|uniref:hypothetical protein n=1 Tax=Nostoc sp. TaxID=1180 RepID=UPI002FFC0F79
MHEQERLVVIVVFPKLPAIAITTNNLAHAAEFNFNCKGNTGYSAKGSKKFLWKK